MKIGVATIPNTYQVNLPPEIITLIVHHAFAQDGYRTRTLWSCCLLSRTWYEAAIIVLYERPNLTNQNFDKFVRTICPPVNSHIKRVGLEQLVRYLDMGGLAYESTKSLTARLIRRTRVSLEVFVAPATSFSVSSLAPLSKCANLRILDLSRDFYVILLEQLLRCICRLPIQSLNLPRSALRRPYQLAPKFPDGPTWPATMEHLGINDWLPSDSQQWADLFASLPQCLVSLAFDECFNWQSFWFLDQISVPAVNVRSVRITVRREDGGFPLDLLQKAFPSAVKLVIPAPLTEIEETTRAWPLQERKLRHLVFTRLPNAIRETPVLTCDLLFTIVKKFPALYRIDLPRSYFGIDDEEIDRLDELGMLMASRIDADVGSGIYVN